MADETTNTNVTENQNATPTVEDLMSQLAAANAEKEQLRNSLTKSNSEAAGYKKALREKQSAEEAEADARAEAEKLQKEELEALKKELNYSKALGAYREISDEKAVAKLIEAVSNADHTSIAQIIANECKKAVANAQVEWLESRPAVNHGAGEAVTREQIMAIKDTTERRAAIAKNIELFS